MTEAGTHRVFITNQDPEVAHRVKGYLKSRGMDMELLPTVDDLGSVILNGEFDLIIISGGLREEPVKRLLVNYRNQSFKGAVIGFWGGGSLDEAEKLKLMGIDDLLMTPPDMKEVELVSKRLLEREELVARTGIIGKSEIMKELLEKVVRFAPVNSTVLVLGESGTGKELIAKALHLLSPRNQKAFIAVNCAALPEGILESELFGHEKGSFTGASALRKGRFEIAHGGTLFLDEIAEMSPSTQVHLLRVLEEREIMRVGGSVSISVDVRVVAATNRELKDEVDAGRFRRDLYYRLKVLTIEAPPLRERRSDIPLLVNRFIKEFCERNRVSFAGLTEDALEVLKNYDWPGNIRELRNLIESMLVLSPGNKIRATDIPDHIYRRGDPRRLLPIPVLPEIPAGREFEAVLKALLEIKRDIHDLTMAIPSRGAGEVFPIDESHHIHEAGDGDGALKIEPGTSLQDAEKLLVKATLDMVGGNRRMASELLGIGERTLYRKLKDYDLS
jgi:DNA-binding NtrC family response regulator